jgi:hypothetical protein
MAGEQKLHHAIREHRGLVQRGRCLGATAVQHPTAENVHHSAGLGGVAVEAAGDG